jgi:4'-phosphopantetheinyl transferase
MNVLVQRRRVVRLAPGVLVAVARHRPDCAVPADEPDAEPDAEDVAAARAMPSWRAAEFLAGRATLRRLLALVAGERAARARVAATGRGRPYLPELRHLSVSVSHTDGWIAAAVGEHRSVGVDVQAPAPVADAVLRRCCTDQSLRFLTALPAARRAVEFAWIWSVQEACVKAAGLGLAGQPWRIPVRARASAGRWRDYQWTTLRGRFPVPVSCAYGDGENDAAGETGAGAGTSSADPDQHHVRTPALRRGRFPHNPAGAPEEP